MILLLKQKATAVLPDYNKGRISVCISTARQKNNSLISETANFSHLN